MNQTLLSQAKCEAFRHKFAAEQAYKLKRQKLEADDEYKATYKEYQMTINQNAKAEVYGEKIDNDKILKLQQKLANLEKKYNVSNVNIEYRCPLCKDEGTVNGSPCTCLNMYASEILIKETGLTDLPDFTSAMQTCAPEHKEFYKKMLEWCSNGSKNLIYIFGPVGSGKTYLTKCMAYELIHKKQSFVIITNALNISMDFVDYKTNEDNTKIVKYLSPDVLILDDLGAEFVNSKSIQLIYRIISERLQRNKKTVITSNLTPADLCATYDERLSSRISDKSTSIIFELTGKDRRLNI